MNHCVALVKLNQLQIAGCTLQRLVSNSIVTSYYRNILG